jgi:hypothetical protein
VDKGIAPPGGLRRPRQWLPRCLRRQLHRLDQRRNPRRHRLLERRRGRDPLLQRRHRRLVLRVPRPNQGRFLRLRLHPRHARGSDRRRRVPRRLLGRLEALAGGLGFCSQSGAFTCTQYNINAFDFSRTPAAGDALALTLRYVDGFVATLNGVEVARDNAPATTSRSALGAEPATFAIPLSLLQQGTNTLAITAYNDGVADPDFILAPELAYIPAHTGTLNGAVKLIRSATLGGPATTNTLDATAFPLRVEGLPAEGDSAFYRLLVE